jgi:enterochelin esterase family protein
MYTNWLTAQMTITEETITINSELLDREVTITLLMPGEYPIAEPLSLWLLNDGQEVNNLDLCNTFQKLYNTNRIQPVVVAAIHASDERLMEYGVTGYPDFKGRGAKAATYTRFVLDELLPQLYHHLKTKTFAITAFAGFSLGGLAALDVACNNPDIFDKVGVFSGSFWWRSKALADGYTDNDRIMHRIIRESKVKPDLKFWLQTGTLDETADRNKNGIIDSIDDTIDLIAELEAKGFKRPNDIQYLEMVGGKHDMATWAKAMPQFLIWAFGC